MNLVDGSSSGETVTLPRFLPSLPLITSNKGKRTLVLKVVDGREDGRHKSNTTSLRKEPSTVLFRFRPNLKEGNAVNFSLKVPDGRKD